MRYAKLINNQIHYAPNPINEGGNYIGNPPDEIYIEQGFLPVIRTDPPEPPEGYYCSPHWEEQDGQIVQRWEVKEIPISDEEALTRYANTLTGADDPDLISAAETLIDKYSESKDKAEAYDILIGGAE